MIATAFRRVADRLLVVDPGLARFVTASRATLSTLLTAWCCLLLAAWLGVSPVVASVAVLFSMIAPLFLRDETLREWLISLLCMYVAAVWCFATASALDTVLPMLGDIAFVALIFTGILVQALGPRALGCALTGIVAFYLGLYLRPTATDVAVTLISSAIAPCVVALVCRCIMPRRPQTALRLAVRTVTTRARALLKSATPAALSSLNEAAIAFEDRLASIDSPDADALREALIELEIRAGQHVFDQPARDLAKAIERLERLSTTIIAIRPRSSGTTGFVLSWMPATRTAAAAFMAMGAGHLLSSDRWFWAVITTFVVFLNTRSRGDTLHRAAQRMVATLAGGLVSVLCVTHLQGEPFATAIAMLLCVFGWAYFILSAYGQGVFFITVLVSLIYGALGHAVVPLVEMRIEEIAIGCAASVAAAFVIRPHGTTQHVETRFFAVVDALIDSMRNGASVRTLDRRWHEFRAAWRPQKLFMWETQGEHVVGALQCCVHRVRAAGRADVHAIAQIVERLEAVRTGDCRPATPIRSDDDTLIALDGAVALLAQRIGERDRSMSWWQLKPRNA
jgi:hypothetical protein